MEKEKLLYRLVAKALRSCFLLSFVIISFGLILLIFAKESFDLIQSQTLISFSWSLEDLFVLKPLAWIQAGILCLLFTPFATVLISFLAFLFSKERAYALVSAGVFLILTLSLVLALYSI